MNLFSTLREIKNNAQLLTTNAAGGISFFHVSLSGMFILNRIAARLCYKSHIWKRHLYQGVYIERMKKDSRSLTKLI